MKPTNTISLCLLLVLIPFNSCNSQTKPKENLQENCKDCNFKDSNGKKQGLWIEDNGLREIYYKNDLRDGIFKAYFRKNGKLSGFGKYENGERVDTWYYFDEQSKLLTVEKEIGDNAEISVQQDDGKTIKPKFKSYIISYHPNGMIKEEGLALHDGSIEIDFVKAGVWKYYDQSGNLIKTENN